MKGFNLTPERKKWVITACLLAAVGGNLGHLSLDNSLIAKNTEGQMDLAQTALPEGSGRVYENDDSLDPAASLGPATYRPPATRPAPSTRPQPAQVAAAAKPEAAAPAAPSAAIPAAAQDQDAAKRLRDQNGDLAARGRQDEQIRQLQARLKKLEGQGSSSTTTSVSGDSFVHKEVINGKEVVIRFSKRGNTTDFTYNDPNDDPYRDIRKTEGGFCPNCPVGKNLAVPFEDGVQKLVAAFKKQYEEDLAAAKKKKEDAEKTEVEVAKMTQAQKDKKADELLAEVAKKCDKGSKKDESSVRCFSSELKSLLSNSDNKEIISEDKVDRFVEDKIKPRLQSALEDSKFSKTAMDQIEKLHKALPGKYDRARTALRDASEEALSSHVRKVNDKFVEVRDKLEDAKATYDEAREIARRDGTGKNLRAAQTALRNYNKVLREYTKVTGETIRARNKINSNSFIRDLLREHKDGLEWAVSKKYIDSDYADSMTSHLRDRWENLWDDVENTDDRISRRIGRLSDREPKTRNGARNTRGSRNFTEGVNRLEMGSPIKFTTRNRGTTFSNGTTLPAAPVLNGNGVGTMAPQFIPQTGTLYQPNQLIRPVAPLGTVGQGGVAR